MPEFRGVLRNSAAFAPPDLTQTLSVPAWSPSTNVPTPALVFDQTITAPAWSASTSVPTPTITSEQDVVAPPWSSSTSVPTPTIALTDIVLAAPPWSASTSVPTPSIDEVVDVQVTPARGRNTGGDVVFFLGSQLDMSGCLPNLTDGALDPVFWTDLSSGSGVVTESAASQTLTLNTGSTGGSVAGVRTSAVATDVDVEVQASTLVEDSASISALELALFVDASNQVRLTVAQGNVTLRVVAGGLTNFESVVAATGGTPRLRLLRAASEVWVFCGGRLITTTAWVSTDCRIELRCANNASVTSQSAARINRYIRRPVVLFEGRPVLDIELVNDQLARGSTPARPLPGQVDIDITGCGTMQQTLTNGFEYFLDPRFASTGRAVAVSDTTVSGRVGRSI